MATVLTVGDVVRLIGLISNPLLNGAVGIMIGDTDFESRGRFAISLQSPAAAVTALPDAISLCPKNLIKIIECARPGCNQVGTKSCSASSKESYCSLECEKAICNTHKVAYRLIKLMPDILQLLEETGLAFLSILLYELGAFFIFHVIY
jgi:hypothetical protein